MRAETARNASYDARVPPGAKTIPPEDRVEPQPDELYRPPAWLSKTATAAQVKELAELLGDLRDVNREFAGERIREVAVYFTATGLHLDLRGRFRDWCDGYVRRRADPANMNPGVGPHPRYLHMKVIGEVARLLCPLIDLPRTLHVGLLAEPARYADWLCYDLLWKGDVQPEQNGMFSVPADLPGGEAMAQHLYDYAADRNYLDNQMPSFLDRVGTWAAGLGRRAPLPARHAVASLADDIQVMRPLLVRNFRPEKTRLRLADDLWVGWSWQVADGIAFITAARSETELLTALVTHWAQEAYVVRHDGLFGYRRTPWRTAAWLPGEAPMAANHALLEWFRDRLFSFYDQIDRSRAGPDVEWTVTGTGETDERTTFGGKAVASAPPGTAAGAEDRQDATESVRRVLGLRFRPFMRVLERIGCEVRGAKGSEVSVYRPGVGRYVFGRHRTNREVFPAEVRRVLTRLGISRGEWRAAAGQ